MIKKFSEGRKRLGENELGLLFGVGEVPEKSDLEFYNTFGKDFGKSFDETRLRELRRRPDHPIDMQFIQKLPLETLQDHQGKCPAARFLFNDRRTFDIVVKLMIQNIKI